mmetsp:Transcript_18480/g.45784  ORF Transcript_18480/g.45784 Transcript_18480/m.45784 type:complete len:539 (+) Transcript_18480:56-1672(+)|eukprot:CAMPEP_0116083192 /NCGR_PEP_ID=MMETSP0327-20121206/3136_1 /TAXON_ID=44447 /ORGANISM="Pseudo-nitzschia delicatissima, Strain B596" /LENGTH=538 /DNA_ID=CAMNT_0003574051 /DNA_START=52 /DNA_END=1668 /DNA_ORIENTATION=+
MTILCVATSKNQLKVIEVENKTGDLVRVVQDIDPIVQPAPSNSGVETRSAEAAFDGYDAGESNNSTNSTDNNFIGAGLLGSFSSSEAATTEWIERHPTFDSLLYVFTSFWNKKSAVVTTYRILSVDDHDGIGSESSSERRTRGRLKKLGSMETKGLHVSHVTFSPDNFRFVQDENAKVMPKKTPSIMCVGHYMDGSLSFFDCTRDSALDEPLRVVMLPEVRPETRNTTFPNPLPSIHHVTYNPRPNTLKSSNVDDNDDHGDALCKYLLVSDTSNQGRVWTFAVDSIGLPISDIPVSFRKVTYITPPSGWLTRILASDWVVGLADYRIRRCVVHPSGGFVYMLLEFNAVIQVYEIDPYTGRISGDCLQEVPAIDPSYFRWTKTTGVGVNASAELYATATEVFVSNRGFNFWGGAAESSVRIFSIEDNGAKLVLKQSLECKGPVRHFVPDHHNRRFCPEVTSKSSDNYFSNSPVALFVGSNRGRRIGTPNDQSSVNVSDSNSAAVETFVRRDPEALGGIFERVGLANVGMNEITCIAVLD